MTLDQRLDLARQNRAAGLNCAQCVATAFPDIFQLPADSLLRLTIGLGGGMGLSGSTCGALSVMALAEGMRSPGSPAAKAQVYKNFRSLSEQFRERFGSTLCPELKQKGVPCNDLILGAVEIYHNHLQK